MSTAVAIKLDPMADFQAKLQERVRDDIRNLLPEEAVAALVKKAVEDEFFKPQTVLVNSWETKEVPSKFMAAVVDAAKPIIAEAVAKVVSEHPAAVEKAIKDFLDENRLTIATTDRMTRMLSDMIMTLQQNLSR